MIEQITNLLRQAGATQMTLNIQPMEGDNVAVVANTLLGNDTGNADVRSALSRPLVLKGFVGEVDAFFCEQLTTYASTFTPAAQQYTSNLSEVAKGHQQGKGTKADCASPDVASESKPVEAPAVAAPVDKFASGDADSL